MKQYKTTGMLIFFLVLLVASFIYILNVVRMGGHVQEIDYSAFVQKVKSGEIAKVKINMDVVEGYPKENFAKPSVTKEALPPIKGAEEATAAQTPSEKKLQETGETTEVTEELKAPGQLGPDPDSLRAASLIQNRYKVNVPNEVIVDDLVPTLNKYKVKYEFLPPQQENRWWSILSILSILSLILFFGIFMFRSAQGGGSQALSFGKSRAKMMLDNKVKVTFKDVAGIDESKAELEEVVDFLKNAERYQKLGAKIPRGVLLVGSPGTGKTLLAKAVAGEAGVPFFSISGSDFVEMFVGVGASRVRDLFEQAKKHAPCIIFVDEIDAVGRQRGAGLGGGHDEREQTLNQLLVEMDGFDQTTGIIVLAATNRPDILDQALLRPGRFDRQVVIDRPDVKGREEILRVHAKGKPLGPDVDLKILARRTPGFTGADLSNLLNEGALLAARQNKEIIEMKDIESSIDKVVAGIEKKNKLISEREKEITAYHEVGHALIAIMTPGCDPLRKVTIIPRGMALGITWTMPDEDHVHMSKTQILSRIAMTLGGRAAEEIIYGEMFTGASNDLEQVSKWARRLVTTFGMSESLGPMAFGKENHHVFLGRDFGTDRDYSEEVAIAIDREVKRLVDIQYKYAKQLLSSNRDVMDHIVKTLLEKETLEDVEVFDIVEETLARRGQPPSCLINGKSVEERRQEEAEILANKGKKPKNSEDSTDPDDKGTDTSVNGSGEKTPVTVTALAEPAGDSFQKSGDGQDR